MPPGGSGSPGNSGGVSSRAPAQSQADPCEGLASDARSDCLAYISNHTGDADGRALDASTESAEERRDRELLESDARDAEQLGRGVDQSPNDDPADNESAYGIPPYEDSQLEDPPSDDPRYDDPPYDEQPYDDSPYDEAESEPPYDPAFDGPRPDPRWD